MARSFDRLDPLVGAREMREDAFEAADLASGGPPGRREPGGRGDQRGHETQQNQ